ncbi:Chitinase [Fusarium sp. LHS14.1]|nr:Chitinase [Fusarium sp. LHS14.1]
MASKKPWSAFALAMVLMANLLPLAVALPNLRIIPLGDSITKGSSSSGIVGYRGPLRSKLLSQGKDDGITIDMVGSLRDGKRILPVPIDIGPGDLWDEKHPNDKGYEKIANAWLKAILEADSRGYLKKPVAMTDDDAPNTGIGNSADGGSEIGGSHGKIWEKKGTVFEGFRTWETVGTIAAAAENGSRAKLILADLNGDGISDYVLADNDGTVRAWINGGKPNSWTSLGKVNPGWSSIKGDMIRMADIDNDGKVDLIILYSDGVAKVWKNIDNGKKFEALDSKWAIGLASSEKVHFEDIDGDGYADYVIVYSGGGKNWENDKAIAPGPASMLDNRARIRDIDGDGKSDYLVVYNGGAVKAWRNTIRDGGTNNNWADLGTIAPGVSGVTGNMIRFADMDGDGLPDFLAVADDGSIRMWKNLGIAGTKGASLRFADLTGDSKDDIISVDAKGRARAWTNKGVDKWESMGEIAPGLDEDLSSARIEFADINGDKKADYLVIYGGGIVKAYLNNGNLPNPGNNRIWQNPITLSPSVGEPSSKGEGQIVATGVGEPGSKIRFADLTGDGKADYIVQYDRGAAKAYRNLGPVYYADINGDKKADYLVAFDGGAINIYINLYD